MYQPTALAIIINHCSRFGKQKKADLRSYSGRMNRRIDDLITEINRRARAALNKAGEGGSGAEQARAALN